MTVLLTSVLTCPHCSTTQEVEMPTDACAFFHQCHACEKVIKAKAGDCCVFCSYGSVSCPPVQAETRCA